MGRPQGPMPQSSIQNRAAQLREEAERKNRRTRNMVWGGIVALLVVAIAVVAWVVTHQDKVGPGADAFGDFNGGKPVVIYKDTVGATVPSGVAVVDEYVSYSCSHCADVEAPIGDKLIERAKEGKFALRLNIVPTAAMPWTDAATAGALVTVAHAPEKFVDYHKQAFEFFASQVKAQDGSVVMDAAASLDKAKEIAKNVGLSAEQVNMIDAKLATNYLKTTSEDWAKADIKGRDPQKYGTPMYVVNGTEVPLSEFKTPEDLLGAVDSAVAKK